MRGKTHLLLLVLLVISSCAKKEETEDLVRSGGSDSNPNELSCTYYEDGGTYSYWACLDYSDDANDYNSDQILALCDQLTSGQVSEGCSDPFLYASGTYTSDGVCVFSSSGDIISSRVYYDVVGDGPSESAICTALSGAYTAD